MPIIVLIEPWRGHPLAWIHRLEARAIIRELRELGHSVQVRTFHHGAVAAAHDESLLLRLSDPVLLDAVRTLARTGKPYFGPGAKAMERCYDKYEAWCVAARKGVTVPATALARNAGAMPFPLIVKPRCGSDSIGLRVVRAGPIPTHLRTDRFIAQEFVRGSELTVGVLHGHIGMPTRILLPEGTPFRFWRKYLWPPRREPVHDMELVARVRDAAQQIALALGVDWAARIDFIHETATDRLCFLECDVAPLVGPASAFAASLAASGMDRHEQLRELLGPAN